MIPRYLSPFIAEITDVGDCVRVRVLRDGTTGETAAKYGLEAERDVIGDFALRLGQCFVGIVLEADPDGFVLEFGGRLQAISLFDPVAIVKLDEPSLALAA